MTVKKDLQARFINILCVEDNRINQMILVKSLESLNYGISMANNGVEALALLDNFCLGFDVIIMDCVMPEMDGFCATEIIRHNEQYKKYRNTPIIAMTGNEDSSHKKRCIAVGMNDVLTKPIDSPLLHKKITFWLDPKNRNMRLCDLNSDNESNVDGGENNDNIWDKHSFLMRVHYNNILAKQMISMFLEEMPTVCESLLRAISQENLENTLFLAHKLKGTVKNLSGLKLADLLIQIEHEAQAENQDNLNKLSESLSQEFMALIRHLNAYI